MNVKEGLTMFERFTDKARMVMALANLQAQRFNHEYIGTEHILLAIVMGAPGVGQNILARLDVDQRKVRLEVEKLVKNGPNVITMGKLPLTPRAKILVERAAKEAELLNRNYVGTEHLVIAAALDVDGVAGAVLRSLGLTVEEIRAEVLSLPYGEDDAHSKPQPPAPGFNVDQFMAEVHKPQPPAAKREALIKQIEDAYIDVVLTNNGKGSRPSDRDIATAIADRIRPDLKSAPPKVEKTEGEKIAARMVKLDMWRNVSGGFTIMLTGDGSDNECTVRCLQEYFATIIDQALAAQAAAHQRDLSALKNAMKAKAREWCTGSTHGREELLDALDEVPLTVEAK